MRLLRVSQLACRNAQLGRTIMSKGMNKKKDGKKKPLRTAAEKRAQKKSKPAVANLTRKKKPKGR